MKNSSALFLLLATAIACGCVEPVTPPEPPAPEVKVNGLTVKASLSSGSVWDYNCSVYCYDTKEDILVADSYLPLEASGNQYANYTIEGEFPKDKALSFYYPSREKAMSVPASQKQSAAGINETGKYCWAKGEATVPEDGKIDVALQVREPVAKMNFSTTGLKDFMITGVTLRSTEADLADGSKSVKVSLSKRGSMATTQTLYAAVLPGTHSSLILEIELRGYYKGVADNLLTLTEEVKNVEFKSGEVTEISLTDLADEARVELYAPATNVRVDDELLVKPVFTTAALEAMEYEYTVSNPSVLSVVPDGKNAKIKALAEGTSSLTITAKEKKSMTCTVDITVKPKALRIIAYGNSFSRDAIEQNLWELFNAAGINAVVGNMYHGGCSLQMHDSYMKSGSLDYSYRKVENGVKTQTDNVNAMKGILDEAWDYISFQQGAGLYAKFDSFQPYMDNVVGWCREHCPNPDFKRIYHLTWAAAANSTNAHFANYFNNDQMYMYTESNKTMVQVQERYNFDVIVNSIDGIQNGRTSYIGDNFNSSDGWHLGTYGKFVAACVWFEQLTKIDVTTIEWYPLSLKKSEADLLKYAAHMAVLHPMEITDLSSFKPEEEDPGSSSEELLAKWIFDKNLAVSEGWKDTYTSAETALGSWIYDNRPGEVAYIPANGGGKGKLSVVQIDKTQWTGEKEKAGRRLLNGTPGGQPDYCGFMPGDYWLFETQNGKTLKAGTKLKMTYTCHANQYGPKYWRVEYLDGETWKPASATRSISLASGETVDYNVEMPTNAKHDIVINVTLSSDTAEFKVRMVCCSTFQVNAKYWDHPNTPANYRIAGTADDGNLPMMYLVK